MLLLNKNVLENTLVGKNYILLSMRNTGVLWNSTEKIAISYYY